MRILLIILICLTGFATNAQQTFTHGNTTSVDYNKGMSTADGGVRLPKVMPPRLSQTDSVGLLYYNPADSSVYVFTGTQWVKVSSGGGGGGTPGGSNKQYQYNNSGSFAGSSYMEQLGHQLHVSGGILADDSVTMRGAYVAQGTSGGKQGFYGTAPTVKPSGDVATALAALGLLTSGSYAWGSVTGTPSTIAGYGITDGVKVRDSTALYSTKEYRQKGIDSVVIWANGRFLTSYTPDSTVYSTKAWRQKGIDSVAAYAATKLSGNQTVTLSGDVTGSGATAIATTLKNTGTAGSYGSSTQIPVIYTDAQGRVYSVVPTAIGTLNQNTTGTAANVTGTVAIVNGGTGATTTTSVNGTPFTYGANNTVTSSGVNSVVGTANQVTVSGTNTVTVALASSAALPGSPTTTTQSAGDNSTKVATTAYVDQVGPQLNSAASYSVSTTPTSSVADARSVVYWDVTAQAGALLFNAPTGSWANHQLLCIRIKDNGTARALTYNSIYRAGTTVSFPTTTTISKTIYLLLSYNTADTKFDLLAYTDGY